MSDMTEVAAIDKEIAELQAKRKAILDEKRKDALKQARELIRAFDITAAELGLATANAASARATNKTRAPKYANPADPTQTYAGGAKPAWVREYETGGGKLEDLLIKK